MFLELEVWWGGKHSRSVIYSLYGVFAALSGGGGGEQVGLKTRSKVSNKLIQ